MSLYNTLFGVDQTAADVLGLLGIEAAAVPRFRDAYVDWSEGSSTDPVLVLLTRTGGGNRPTYAGENEALTRLPGYRSDRDDAFDSTFALFLFDVPEARRQDAICHLIRFGRPKTLREKFEAATKAMGK